jgi:glycine cleavage system H protein
MANNSDDRLELTVDKFTFRFPKDLLYSEAGLWIRREAHRLRLGLSDFAQQRSGDIAFANLMPPGTVLAIDDEIASIETVKVDISLPSPVKGKILEINSGLQDSPEWINQDPYGKGWMIVVEPEDPSRLPTGVLDPESYLSLARQQAEAELKS